MGEVLQVPTVEVPKVVVAGAGRITILEAMATQGSSVSPDAMGRTTMQGNVDFDD